MLDQYVHGSVRRISPEAPVPVVEVSSFQMMPGGAANVALNLKSMEAEVALVGICGKDKEGQILKKLLYEKQIRDFLLMDMARPTTMKTRIMGNNVQMLRMDRENNEELTQEWTETAKTHLRTILEGHSWQIVVLQDYDKGFLNNIIIRFIIDYCKKHKIPVVADPKRRHYWDYADVNIFKPNFKELLTAFGMTDQKINPIGTEVEKLLIQQRLRMPHDITLLTLGDKGLWISTDDHAHIEPTKPRYVSDVSGAGDTVAALAALCLAVKADILDLAILCNLGGGRVCEQSGVSVITPESLIQEIEEYAN